MRSLLCLFSLAFSSTVLAADPLAEVRRPLVQGDVRGALAALEAIPAGSLTGKDADMARCLPQRFASDDAVHEPGEPGAVLAAYRRYWRARMLGRADKPAAEASLLADLNALLPDDPRQPWNRASLDETTSQARRHLERQGLHVLTGITHPYYEFMAWRRQETVRYRVALPEQEVEVPVVFLDDFVSRGWLAYASCGRYGAGGWTAAGTLYALGDRYDRSSEEFRVSYLGHEGQHFADNRRYPRLEQPELEYRAKLTELALSSGSTAALLKRFASQGQVGRSAPHAHAEYWLAHDLQAELGATSLDDAAGAGVRTAARRLLERSSIKAAAGAPRFLPD